MRMCPMLILNPYLILSVTFGCVFKGIIQNFWPKGLIFFLFEDDQVYKQEM